MNKLIIAAIIAGLSGSVFAGVGDVQSDTGNHDGIRVGLTSGSDGSERQMNVFGAKSSAKLITGSQPEIGSARKYALFGDVGNH